MSHCLWLKYCHRCLIWIANGQNLHFVQKYLCVILLRRDLNISGCETDEKLTRLCRSSMYVLPSESCDWKLWGASPHCPLGSCKLTYTALADVIVVEPILTQAVVAPDQVWAARGSAHIWSLHTLVHICGETSAWWTQHSTAGSHCFIIQTHRW